MLDSRNILVKKDLDNKKVLVVRTDKIGDLILSLPFGKFIKRIFPNSKVFYLIKEGNSVLLQRVSFVDGFLEIRVKRERGEVEISEVPKIVNFLKKEKFDIAFLLYPRFSIALILKLAGIKMVGTSRRFFSPFFDIKVDISRKKNLYHEAFYNLMLLEHFVDVHSEKVLNELSPDLFTDDINRISSLPEKYVVFHPFSTSSPSIPSRSWIEISKNLQTQVVWVGKGPEHYKNEIEKSATGISLINKTSLQELISVIKFSLGVFSTSSGPIHIASALGVPTIGLYRKQDILRWRPIWGKTTIINIERVKWDDSIAIRKISSEIEESVWR